MKIFEKIKKKYKENKEERAELERAYKEEYAKEKALQESGRKLASREEARERARAKARQPALSQRMKKGADKFAIGVGKMTEAGLKKLSEMDKQQPAGTQRKKTASKGVDFLGVGGGSGLGENMFNNDFLGTHKASKSRKRKARLNDFGGFF